MKILSTKHDCTTVIHASPGQTSKPIQIHLVVKVSTHLNGTHIEEIDLAFNTLGYECAKKKPSKVYVSCRTITYDHMGFTEGQQKEIQEFAQKIYDAA